MIMDLSFAVVAFFMLIATIVNAENCDSGSDIPRDDVVVTDLAFQVTSVDYDTTGSDVVFPMDMLFFPQQVLPMSYMSSVFMYMSGIDSLNFVDDGDCGFAFDFGTGANGEHGSKFDIPVKCLSQTEGLGENEYPKQYVSNIEYWYCIGEVDTCDRVTETEVGYLSGDRQSLENEHYCSRLVYDVNVTINSDGLDDIVDFVLIYIRDPVDTDSIDQFFDAKGNAQALENPVHYAVCDYNEEGDIEWQECFARMALTPEPRVLEMSTPTLTNPFSMSFTLTGSDTDLVTSGKPLTIDVLDSQVFLFHALYSGDYSECDVLCSEHTTFSNIDPMQFDAVTPTETENFYEVALEGNMPIFDETTDMDCDQSFCTMVLRLNFESYEGGVRRLFSIDHRMEFSSPPKTRLLEESATQSKATKVKATRQLTIATPPPTSISTQDTILEVVEDSFPIIIVLFIVLLGVGSCSTCFYCYGQRKNKDDNNEQQSNEAQFVYKDSYMTKMSAV